MAGVVRTGTVRSAARRSSTGAENVTTTGCATPTTAPDAGPIDTMPPPGDWPAAAELRPAGITNAASATPTTTTAERTDFHILGVPSRTDNCGFALMVKRFRRRTRVSTPTTRSRLHKGLATKRREIAGLRGESGEQLEGEPANRHVGMQRGQDRRRRAAHPRQ